MYKHESASHPTQQDTLCRIVKEISHIGGNVAPSAQNKANQEGFKQRVSTKHHQAQEGKHGKECQRSPQTAIEPTGDFYHEPDQCCGYPSRKRDTQGVPCRRANTL